MSENKISTIGANEAMSDADRARLEAEIFQEGDYADPQPENLLVRGALMGCRCGTHKRRLNIPLSYGSYADSDDNQPFVCEKDCLVGDDKNISYFGVCKSEKTPPGAQKICLKPYDCERHTGAGENMNDIGPMCMPVIMGSWLNPAQNDHVDINDEKGNLIEMAKKLKSGSKLICKYGGIIDVLESGQGFMDL